jgi:TonB family protein
MRNIKVTMCITLAACPLISQTIAPVAPASSPDVQAPSVKIFTPGPGVTAPDLLPLSMAPIADEKCKKKEDGKVLLSLFVDTDGRPRNIMFIHPLASELDTFALRIASLDRFKPGTVDDQPVVVAESLEIGIQSCIQESKNSAGKKSYSLRMRSVPSQRLETFPHPPEEARLESDNASWKATGKLYKVGDGVSPPATLNNVEAEFTDSARDAKYQGTCLLSLIVDEHGMPENITVVRGLDHGLTENSINAVRRYRFKPAMKNGEPVPVKISIEVKYKLG